MKERMFIAGLVTLLGLGGLQAMGSADGVYVAASILFFVICIAYAEWCERL